MKEIKTKHLTGIPIVDKHLISGKLCTDDIYDEETDDIYVFIEYIDKYYPDKIDIVIEYYGYQNILKSHDADIYEILIKHDYALSELIDHPFPRIRGAIADKGYALDILSKDKNGYVRSRVVAQGYKPEEFIHDESPIVRLEVVKQGVGWDELHKDPYDEIQIYLAEKGYTLKKNRRQNMV